jgi:hypothetical protein
MPPAAEDTVNVRYIVDDVAETVGLHVEPSQAKQLTPAWSGVALADIATAGVARCGWMSASGRSATPPSLAGVNGLRPFAGVCPCAERHQRATMGLA